MLETASLVTPYRREILENKFSSELCSQYTFALKTNADAVQLMQAAAIVSYDMAPRLVEVPSL